MFSSRILMNRVSVFVQICNLKWNGIEEYVTSLKLSTSVGERSGTTNLL